MQLVPLSFNGVYFEVDVCILSDRMSQIRFDSPYLLNRIFSIKSAAQSNVEYFTFELFPIGCRIFNIRPAQDAVCNF